VEGEGLGAAEAVELERERRPLREKKARTLPMAALAVSEVVVNGDLLIALLGRGTRSERRGSCAWWTL
jgi:hypothetical protein